MIIERPFYLEKLKTYRDNGRVKVITGVRRSGKSYLLRNIYRSYLLSTGVENDHVIEIALDELKMAQYRDPFKLDEYIRNSIRDEDNYYVFIDEIQNVPNVPNPYLEGDTVGFVEVLLGLMNISNLDVYITGSNSRMLSSDIVTQFRDRGDEIRVYPLSFSEFYNAFEGDKRDAWNEYYVYGGLPRVMQLKTQKEKSDYLSSLIENTYLKDVIERNNLREAKDLLDDILNEIASSIGSLTNPLKLANTINTRYGRKICSSTVANYLDCFRDAFVVDKALRYDIKGKKYINTPLKYYFVDTGLRNARLNFRQLEENHIMENILYNELRHRGYNVDVGVVEQRSRNADGKYTRTYYEIDFVANSIDKTYYIQTALNVDTVEKRIQETNSLVRVPDSFRKIVVIKDDVVPWHDENGILYIGIQDYLRRPKAIDM